MSHQRHQTQSLEGIVKVQQHGRVRVELVERARDRLGLLMGRRMWLLGDDLANLPPLLARDVV
jgi:hypothetical protein